MAHGELRPIIGAVDDTFLPRMILGCMDLASGYLLLEERAVHRPDDTWDGLVKARRKTLGVEGSSLVRDRAKARIKLAETGLNGLRIPEVFPLRHELAKLARELRQLLRPEEKQGEEDEDSAILKAGHKSVP